MVDFRLNKIWMEAKIVSVQDRSIEVLCFDLDNKQDLIRDLNINRQQTGSQGYSQQEFKSIGST